MAYFIAIIPVDAVDTATPSVTIAIPKATDFPIKSVASDSLNLLNSTRAVDAVKATAAITIAEAAASFTVRFAAAICLIPTEAIVTDAAKEIIVVPNASALAINDFGLEFPRA